MARVLVAEDDNLTRHFLKQALEFCGHEVTAVEDGAAAIAALDEPGRFDAVITDYAMPHATGIDVIAHGHRVDPMVAFIVVTAFRELDVAIEAMHAGAVAFVPKPCKPDHLSTVLNSALERRQLAEEALRLRALTPMLERFTMVLANTIESKDAATQRHANRLVNLSQLIAQRIGLDGDDVSAVRFGACLHDIGKVAIPEALLRKPAPLTATERDLLRLHPEIGAVMLDGIETWEEVRRIIRHHHEHFDGTGYPDGLAGMTIPIGARIVSIVDAFDVMRTGRPYAAPRSFDETLGELVRMRGIQFDPDLVDTMVDVVSDESQADAIAAPSAQPLFAAGLDGHPAEVSISGWLASAAPRRRARLSA